MKKFLILVALVAVSAGFYIASAQTAAPTTTQTITVTVPRDAASFDLPDFTAGARATSHRLRLGALERTAVAPSFKNIPLSGLDFDKPYTISVFSENNFGQAETKYTLILKQEPEAEYSLDEAFKLALVQSIYKDFYLKAAGVGPEAFVAALDIATAEALKTIQNKTIYEIKENDATQIFKDLSPSEVRLLVDIKTKERTGEKVVYTPDNAKVVPELSIYNRVADRPTIAKRFATFFSTFILRRPAPVEEVLPPETRVAGTANALERIQRNMERFNMLEKEGFMYAQGLIQVAQELETKGATAPEKTAYKAIAHAFREMKDWGEVANVEKEIHIVTSAVKNFTLVSKGKKFAKKEDLAKAIDELYMAKKAGYEAEFKAKQGQGDQILGGTRGLTPINIDPGSLTRVCLPSSQPWLEVVSPNGGEIYPVGQLINVTWKSCNIPLAPTNPQVSIKLVHTLNWTYPTNYTQVTAAPNTSTSGGSATFALPDSSWFVLGAFQSGPNAKYYKIKISAYTNPSVSDTSNSEFTIN